MQTRELCSGNVLQEGAAGASSLVCTGLYGRRVSAEPHPHQSTRPRELQCALLQFFLYLRQKASFTPSWEHFSYSHEVWPRFGAKSVSVLCCCKFTFFVSKFGKRVELVLFLISFNMKLFTAEFTTNNRFTARVNMKAVLTSLNMAFLPISWSRFK